MALAKQFYSSFKSYNGWDYYLEILGLATGGLVTGPTMALVGEGAGTTASNPEVVAPLDKLKNLIGGGTQQVEVYGRISGNDIFLANQRGSINRFRSV